MDKVNAILESYDVSCRITPERPLKNSAKAKGCMKRRAYIYHWQESDSMDIFFCPPPNPANAASRLVHRFAWGGSVTRSIYGTYRINLNYADDRGEPFKASEYQSHLREVLAWIAEDKKTFVPEPQPKRKRRR